MDGSRFSQGTLKIHEKRNSGVDEINSIVRLVKNWRQTMRFNPFIWGLDKRFFIDSFPFHRFVSIPSIRFHSIDSFPFHRFVSIPSIRFHSIDRPLSRFARLLCWFLLTANEDLRDQSFTSRSDRERDEDNQNVHTCQTLRQRILRVILAKNLAIDPRETHEEINLQIQTLHWIVRTHFSDWGMVDIRSKKFMSIRDWPLLFSITHVRSIDENRSLSIWYE